MLQIWGKVPVHKYEKYNCNCEKQSGNYEKWSTICEKDSDCEIKSEELEIFIIIRSQLSVSHIVNYSHNYEI